ncbi:MAG TPA: UDP-3-O-(3-hydroxymyristoyl)glucosamine N-acyltransferase [Cellvibrionaceae bacterium]
MSQNAPNLEELAQLVNARLIKAIDASINRVATLRDATDQGISFYNNTRYLHDLKSTQAGAVILRAEHAADCPTSALIVDDPYHAYAVIASHLHPRDLAPKSIHPTAIIAADAKLGADVAIGAYAVIHEGANIGAGTEIGSGCSIGKGAIIGANGWLADNVSIGAHCQIGDNSIIHPGVVIGADGFGFAPGGGSWQKIPQLGRVCIGDDVEIGANSTLDRGTLDDTVVEDGVKIDNLVHIGHNSRIGTATIIAGCTVVAGSTTIGKNCIIGGATAITGHINIADGVTLMGMTGVTGSIREAGVYASPLPAQPVKDWRRNTVRYTQLDEVFRRVKSLERELENLKELEALALHQAS